MYRVSGKSLPSWAFILIAMLLGMATGVVAGDHILWIKVIGDIFVALIRMMVMPVIFVSLVCGMIAMRDVAQMRRIAWKTLSIYIVTMVLAAALAMSLAHGFGIGSGLGYVASSQSGVVASTIDLTSLMPSNPVKAMAEGQVLPVMLFALFLGLAINLSGEAGRPVALLFEAGNRVVIRLVQLVLAFAPLGVFALMAWLTASSGLSMLTQLAALVGTLYLSCLLVLTLVYGSILRLSGLRALPFMTKMLPVQLFAFSCCSSNASLPLTMETARNRLGVNNSIASFVLPLGSTINMNGLAAYLGAVAVFTANAYGIELTLTQMAMVVAATTFGAIGAAGVPGSGLVVMSMVLSTVGLPLEIIAVVAAVDRLIDMINTSTNISGDTLAAVLVAKSEGELEHSVYSGA